jgi:hypothetical protein
VSFEKSYQMNGDSALLGIAEEYETASQHEDARLREGGGD